MKWVRVLLLLLTTPFLFAGTAIGLFEAVLGTDGAVAAWVARPFLWAVERVRPGRREPPGFCTPSRRG